MTDAIGHPLELGDFVIAVWASGNVELFEIIELRPHGRYNRKMYHEDHVMLQRHFHSKYVAEETQKKAVRKFCTQVTWVDKQTVFLYLLEK